MNTVCLLILCVVVVLQILSIVTVWKINQKTDMFSEMMNRKLDPESDRQAKKQERQFHNLMKYGVERRRDDDESY